MNIHKHNLYANGVLAMDEHRTIHEEYFKVMEIHSHKQKFKYLIEYLNQIDSKWNTFGKLGKYSAEFINYILNSYDYVDVSIEDELNEFYENLESDYLMSFKNDTTIKYLNDIKEYSFQIVEQYTLDDKINDYEEYMEEFEKFKKKYADEVYYDFESEIPIPFDYRQ